MEPANGEVLIWYSVVLNSEDKLESPEEVVKVPFPTPHSDLLNWNVWGGAQLW